MDALSGRCMRLTLAARVSDLLRKGLKSVLRTARYWSSVIDAGASTAFGRLLPYRSRYRPAAVGDGTGHTHHGVVRLQAHLPFRVIGVEAGEVGDRADWVGLHQALKGDQHRLDPAVTSSVVPPHSAGALSCPRTPMLRPKRRDVSLSM